MNTTPKPEIKDTTTRIKTARTHHKKSDATGGSVEIVLAFWLGAILPIYAIPGVGPENIQAAKYTLAAMVALLSIRAVVTREVKILSGWWLLAAAWCLAVAFTRDDGQGSANAILLTVGLILGMLSTKALHNAKWLFVGFIVGVALSGTVAVLQYLGMLPGVTADTVGVERVSGLTFSSPRLSMQLATALVAVTVLANRRNQARVLAIVSIPILLAALMVTGSRIGILALGAGVLAIAARGWVNRFLLAVSVTSLFALVVRAASSGTQLATLNRIEESDQFSSGRSELARSASSLIVESPLFGPGLDTYMGLAGTVPHATPLVVGAIGGLLPAGIFIGITAYAAGLALRVNGSHPLIAMAASSFILSSLVSVLLQPAGTYIGIDVALPLFACLTLVTTVPAGDSAERGGAPSAIACPKPRARRGNAHNV